MYVNSIKFDHKLYLDYGPVILIPTGNEVRNITNRARNHVVRVGWRLCSGPRGCALFSDLSFVRILINIRF